MCVCVFFFSGRIRDFGPSSLVLFRGGTEERPTAASDLFYFFQIEFEFEKPSHLLRARTERADDEGFTRRSVGGRFCYLGPCSFCFVEERTRAEMGVFRTLRGPYTLRA